MFGRKKKIASQPSVVVSPKASDFTELPDEDPETEEIEEIDSNEDVLAYEEDPEDEESPSVDPVEQVQRPIRRPQAKPVEKKVELADILVNFEERITELYEQNKILQEQNKVLDDRQEKLEAAYFRLVSILKNL